jgi:hypothetical protein
MIYEKDEHHIEVPNYLFCKRFVYLLINELDEVVYVGQTNDGLKRPFSHNDKDYKRVIIIECDYTEDMDVLEYKYIKKYNPIYNKIINYQAVVNIKKARSELIKVMRNTSLTIRHTRKVIAYLGINLIHEDEGQYLTKQDFKKFTEYIKINKEDFVWDRVK